MSAKKDAQYIKEPFIFAKSVALKSYLEHKLFINLMYFVLSYPDCKFFFAWI